MIEEVFEILETCWMQLKISPFGKFKGTNITSVTGVQSSEKFTRIVVGISDEN